MKSGWEERLQLKSPWNVLIKVTSKTYNFLPGLFLNLGAAQHQCVLLNDISTRCWFSSASQSETCIGTLWVGSVCRGKCVSSLSPMQSFSDTYPRASQAPPHSELRRTIIRLYAGGTIMGLWCTIRVIVRDCDVVAHEAARIPHRPQLNWHTAAGTNHLFDCYL